MTLNGRTRTVQDQALFTQTTRSTVQLTADHSRHTAGNVMDRQIDSIFQFGEFLVFVVFSYCLYLNFVFCYLLQLYQALHLHIANILHGFPPMRHTVDFPLLILLVIQSHNIPTLLAK